MRRTWYSLFAIPGLAAHMALAIAGEPAAAAGAPKLELADQFGGTVSAIDTAQGRVYLAEGARIAVYDADGWDDGPTPVPVAESTLLPGPVADLVVADGKVYVALSNVGLWILDGARDTLAVIGKMQTASPIADLAVRGGFAYVSEGAAGLRVVDVRDPLRPAQVWTQRMPDRGLEGNDGAAGPMALGNTSLFVFYQDLYAASALLAVYDVQQPDRPDLLAVSEMPVDPPWSVSLEDGRLFVVGGYSLSVIDVSNPSMPTIAGELPVADYRPMYAVAEGDTVFVATSMGDRTAPRSGLAVLDAHDPAAMRELGFLSVSAWHGPAAAADQRVYVEQHVRNGRTGVMGVDVTDPAHPREVGFAPSSPATHVAVDGSTIVLKGGQTSLWSLGLGAHASLQPLADLPAPWDAVDVDVREGVAVVAAGSDGVRLIDAHDPANWREVGLLIPDPLGARCQAVIVGPAAAYVVVATPGTRVQPGDTWLRVIDISGAAPREVGSTTIAPGADHLALLGDTVLAAGSESLQTVDVSLPEHPRPLGLADVAAPVKALAVHGSDIAYMSIDGDLHAYDVSDPAHPMKVAELRLDGRIRGLGIGGDRLFAQVENAQRSQDGHLVSLQMLTADDPAKVRELARVDLPGDFSTPMGPRLVETGGDAVIVAGGPVGLMSVRVGQTPAPVFLPLASRR